VRPFNVFTAACHTGLAVPAANLKRDAEMNFCAPLLILVFLASAASAQSDKADPDHCVSDYILKLRDDYSTPSPQIVEIAIAQCFARFRDAADRAAQEYIAETFPRLDRGSLEFRTEWRKLAAELQPRMEKRIASRHTAALVLWRSAQKKRDRE
jgi:hypothetical protein